MPKLVSPAFSLQGLGWISHKKACSCKHYPVRDLVNCGVVTLVPDLFHRDKLVKWMDTLRLSDGSFVMHKDGEVDIRGVYCALSGRLT